MWVLRPTTFVGYYTAASADSPSAEPWRLCLRTPPRILVVDDNPTNVKILQTRLASAGYDVVTAADGEQALVTARETTPDLILLDVMMPRLDGMEVCRRLRADPDFPFTPIVLVTALSETKDVIAGLEAGGDEYLTKPIDHGALLARVRSMLRIKELHDREQVLKATVVFCDLRGFTAFAELSEPEEVMAVLREYHAAAGALILEYEGTLERFTGDGMMVFFNDPVPMPDAPLRAVRMAVAIRDRVAELSRGWTARGFDLHHGIGIAQGYATLGAIGFEGRWDYGAIGTVTNMAARLCAEAASDEVLVSHRVAASVGDVAEFTEMRSLNLRGFHRPVAACAVVATKPALA